MKKRGDQGELLAIEYLKRHGYQILHTNFKFSSFGEIDIISMIDDITVFIEVKMRTNESFGTPEESITKAKLQKLTKTIQYYCVRHGIGFDKIRFDIITITAQEKSYKLIHYKNQPLGNQSL